MLNQFASLARVDFAPPHRQPTAGRVLLATIASIAGSLAADAILVVIGTAIFPSTRDFAHFQFSDYAKLTVIGVIIACVAWPVVTRISSAPRWLFFRLAILVTLVLLLPDLYILHMGEPGQGGRRAHAHARLDRGGHLQPAGAYRPGPPGGCGAGCPGGGAGPPGPAPARPLTALVGQPGPGSFRQKPATTTLPVM